MTTHKLNKHALLCVTLFSSPTFSQESYWIYYNNSSGFYPDSITACEALTTSSFPITRVQALSESHHACYRVLDSGFEQGYGSVHQRLCPPDATFDPAQGCTFEPINNGNNCNNTNNPINIASGNKFYEAIDYQDSDFTVSRYYNSKRSKWVFNYTQSLKLSRPTVATSDGVIYYAQNEGHIKAYRQDGSLIHFTYDGSVDGSYISPSNRREKLNLVDSGYLETMNYTPYYDPEISPPSIIGHSHSLLLSNNAIEDYNSLGRLVAIRSSNLSTTSLSYQPNHSGKNWPSQFIVTKNSRELIINTDPNFPRISEIFLPDNTRLRYTYANSHVLSSVVRVHPDSEEVVTFRYFNDFSHNPTYITGVENEHGNRISSVQYDREGRAISSEKGPLNSGIERTQITYNADGTRTVTNALGKETTYHFTQFNGEYKITQVEGHASANCAAANQAYTYDANGFMASKTDWEGNTTLYVHNDRGQETSRTEASGTPQARTITTEWHSEWNLPIRITEPERETVMTYDSNGLLLSSETTPLNP